MPKSQKNNPLTGLKLHLGDLRDPVGIRTQDPQLRRLLLYPAELPDQPCLGLLLLWGRVDSNHRTDSRTDLQSVAIATMRLPLNKERFCAAKVHIFSLP